MSRHAYRGMRVDVPSVVGGIYLTLALGANASGSALASPIAMAWPNVDAHVAMPGQTVYAWDGSFHTHRFPAGSGSEADQELGRIIELRLSGYDAVLHELLEDLFAVDTTRAVTLYHRRGTYTASVKPLRGALGPPIQSTQGDHPFVAGEGLELVLRMAVVSGGTWT